MSCAHHNDKKDIPKSSEKAADLNTLLNCVFPPSQFNEGGKNSVSKGEKIVDYEQNWTKL